MDRAGARPLPCCCHSVNRTSGRCFADGRTRAAARGDHALRRACRWALRDRTAVRLGVRAASSVPGSVLAIRGVAFLPPEHRPGAAALRTRVAPPNHAPGGGAFARPVGRQLLPLLRRHPRAPELAPGGRHPGVRAGNCRGRAVSQAVLPGGLAAGRVCRPAGHPAGRADRRPSPVPLQGSGRPRRCV